MALMDQDPIVAEAKERYTQTDAYQTRMIARYRKYHHWYAPANDDQWPEDASERPGKIHITNNFIKPVVDIEARLQAIEPRYVLIPTDQSSQAERARAETVEKMMMEYMSMARFGIQSHTFCRVKALYGKGVWKVFWNEDENRPDVVAVENPQHLRIGWGASDFSVIDWTIYEYSLSPMEVMRRWPHLMVMPTPGREPLAIIPRAAGSHDDPLGQRMPERDITPHYQPSDYERKQVQVWDYWYRAEDGVPMNCIILERTAHAIDPTPHAELPDIPYIITENDHEPGTPEGVSSVAALIDLQIEMNRILSHWAQLIVDETDPSWQIDADPGFIGGIIPKAGQITAAGEGHEIKEIPKQIAVFPIDQLHQTMWFNIERLSGLPQVAFGQTAGSQISGRSLAVQIEATANRLDHKRTLLYEGYVQVLRMWSYMLTKVNPKVKGPDDKMVGIGAIFEGLMNWKIIAPEITPRHVIEHTMNTINKVTNGLMSMHTAMDELGIESPEDEIRMVGEERSDLTLNPGMVMQQLSAVAAAQQLQMNSQMMQAQADQAMAQAQGTAGAGEAAAMAQQQRGQPTLPEDENEPGMVPPTAPGSAPPAPGPGGKFAQTTLVRTNPQGQTSTLGQVSFNRPL